jgi:hypothetical protein
VSTFTALNPIANQCGVQFFMKGVGGTLELAGGGYSQAPVGPTFSYLTTSGNMTGNSGVIPNLQANGLGYPIYAITSPSSALTFFGQPTLWFTSGGTTSQLAIVYLKNSQSG